MKLRVFLFQNGSGFFALLLVGSLVGGLGFGGLLSPEDWLPFGCLLLALFACLYDRYPPGAIWSVYSINWIPIIHGCELPHPRTRLAVFGAPLVWSPYLLMVFGATMPLFRGDPLPPVSFFWKGLAGCAATPILFWLTASLRELPEEIEASTSPSSVDKPSSLASDPEEEKISSKGWKS